MNLTYTRRPRASAEQAAIVQAARTLAPREALVACARAGTGKTFTLVETVKAVSGDVLVLVFGRKAAAEVRTRLKAEGVTANVRVDTCHAFAKSMVSAAEPNFGKFYSIAKTEGSAGHIRNPRLQFIAAELVDLALDLAVGLPGELPATLGTFQDILTGYAKRLPKGAKPEVLAAESLKLFGAVLRDTRTYTFSEYGYIVARDGLPADVRFDYVLLDEAQDLNPQQLRVVDLLRERGARLVFYGDDRQGIYGWRGAGTDTFQAIRSRYSPQVLPIQTTRRCGTAIVEEAQRIVPDIRAVENATEGVVGVLSPLELTPALVQLVAEPEGSMVVLCRNNAPLLKATLNAVRAGLQVCVLGKSPKQTVNYILTRVFDAPNATFHDPEAFGRFEVALRAELADKPFALAEELDRLETARVLYDHVVATTRVTSLPALLAEVAAACAKYFADDEVPGTVTFSTIHRSKGLEWDHVFFLAPELIPGRAARKARGWHLTQEANLAYVAVTRAKQSLIYVSTQRDPLGDVIGAMS
jgi:superfamily I DNA/RNA helicase